MPPPAGGFGAANPRVHTVIDDYAATAAVLLTVTALSSYVPARRAALVDPGRVLRAE